MFMGRSTRSDSERTGLERPWEWPDMDSFTTMGSSGNYGLDPSGADVTSSGTTSSTTRGPGIKTWDVNDPALTLGTFFNSPAWKNQSFIPGSDFVDLLRVLRPVDHAFYIHLFSTRSVQKTTVAKEQDTSNSPTVSFRLNETVDQGCGTWIQDYIAFQNGILDRTLPPHYTIHSCSDKQADSSSRHPTVIPCGNLFSQMVAMTAAFSWSVIESRGFFLRPDQTPGLQESFQTPLVQLWASPPRPESRSQINTEGWTDEYLTDIFGLDDPLFENEDNTLLEEESLQNRLLGLRSTSRNRASFERDLSGGRWTRVDADAIVEKTSSITQRLPTQRQSASTRQRSANEQQQHGALELVLSRDILPQLVNTTKSLSLFLNLGLPLPDKVLQQVQERPGMVTNADHRRPDSIRVGNSHMSSDAAISPESLSNAYHAAIEDSDDPSRIRAVPKTFGCMLDILIQPHIHLQQLIHPYATLLQLPAVFSVGIYIQPNVQNDRYSKANESSPSSAQNAASRDRDLVVERYLTCARQIAREFAPKRQGQKIVFFVVSEDATMARAMESQERWDEEVITPNWVRPKDSDQQQQKYPVKELTQQQRAVLENWILSKTDYQVVSDNSDFAKVAVWRTRRENH
ncbi:hypothetical protein BGZ72_000409, partial [Mortierella alpina]